MSIFLLSGCAALDSSIKEIESDVTGLERIITVYDNSGKVIGKYEGRARIIPSDYGNKVIFELNGKRYNFYNATVAIEEK